MSHNMVMSEAFTSSTFSLKLSSSISLNGLQVTVLTPNMPAHARSLSPWENTPAVILQPSSKSWRMTPDAEPPPPMTCTLISFLLRLSPDIWKSTRPVTLFLYTMASTPYDCLRFSRVITDSGLPSAIILPSFIIMSLVQ